jgi:23S rRNA (cytidine2498-2'-O)-methyltransferase
MQPLHATCYLAAIDHRERLLADLTRVRRVHERLVIADGPPQPAPWAQNVWLDPVRLRFESIADAAKKLRSLGRNWAAYSFRLHRRTQLIVERLPHVSAKPLVFPEPAPTAPLGSFALLDEHELIAAPRCSSPFPNGEARFVEYGPEQGPPNRAYLKLFEALTLLGSHPKAMDKCLDLGASPGGWTWVLSRLGARVIAVDRAPLAPHIESLPNVTPVSANAFNATPDQIGEVDWLVCDVICYPEKLYAFVKRWLDDGACRRFVCTLKFQSDTHYGSIADFRAIGGSRLVHLYHNKHELTWMLVR